jgi:hypothetical protein
VSRRHIIVLATAGGGGGGGGGALIAVQAAFNVLRLAVEIEPPPAQQPDPERP